MATEVREQGNQPSKKGKRERGVSDHVKESEAQRVYSWRTKRFKEMIVKVGIDEEAAMKLSRKLAESSADLHRSEELLAKGCAPKLLLEIYS